MEIKYHIVFAPKFRRKAIYGKIKRDIGVIIRSLCEKNGVELLEAEYYNLNCNKFVIQKQ